MPRQTNGSYQQPAGTTAVGGSYIFATPYNSLITDIGNEITNSLDRQGRSAMLAALQMGGFKITGLANGSASTDAATIGNLSSIIPSGSQMIFNNASAPTGWTQRTDLNDWTIRVVSGAGNVSHGSIGLSQFVALGALDHVLTWNEMPVHSHGVNDAGHAHTYTGQTSPGATGAGGTGSVGTTSLATGSSGTGISIQTAGANYGHTHGLSDLAYVDMILCTKN